jgi:hypothetical protein
MLAMVDLPQIPEKDWKPVGNPLETCRSVIVCTVLRSHINETVAYIFKIQHLEEALNKPSVKGF